jgi:Ferritin-like domain
VARAYLKAKNFHWHIGGAHFRDHHLLLDEQAGEIFAMADGIARWLLRLDSKPPPRKRSSEMNEAIARSFQGRSPVGQRVALRLASSPQAKPIGREIVGVARHGGRLCNARARPGHGRRVRNARLFRDACRVGYTRRSTSFVVSGRLIETMLFGVRPLDLATFAFVTIVLGITAALSIAGPAWGAARIDPAVALRNK